MCGIAGAQFHTFGSAERDQMLTLAELTTQRGRDGFGLAIKKGSDKTKAWRSLVFNRSALREFLDGFLGDTKVSIVMCSRAQPLPEANSKVSNIAPYVGDYCTLVHNGTISNDRELAAEWGIEHTGIDTMVVHAMMEKYHRSVTPELVGGYAFAWIEEATGEITLAKNIKTLWLSRRIQKDSFIFGSEPGWLKTTWHAKELSCPTLEHIPPYTAWSKPMGAHSISNKYWASTPDLDDKKCVVVTSGGIDSITSAYIAKRHLGYDIVLAHFPHGQRSSERELEATKLCAEALGAELVVWSNETLGTLGASPLTDRSIELPQGMQSAESTKCWTPARNMLFLVQAAALAEARGCKWLIYGNNMEEEATAYGDNDLDFIHYMNRTLRYGTLKGVQLKPILRRLMKPEILHVGTHLGVPYDTTWSCDEGFEKPCGSCGCCTTRRMAFAAAALPDMQTYLQTPDTGYPDWEQRSYDITKLLKLTE